MFQAQQGDVQAFDQLVERYHAKIYALTYNMTSNREDAEDLTQEIFVKAFQALPRFKGKSSFYQLPEETQPQTGGEPGSV